MSLTIPVTIAAILPLLATALSSWLADDHLSRGINAAIALVAILLTAIACELLGIGLIPGDPAATVVGILGYVSILMQGDLATLYLYLVAKPSPIAPPTPPGNSTQGRAPTAIVMPRASAGQETQG